MAKKVLGRGLGAFFPDIDGESKDKPGESVSKVPTDPRERVNVILHIPVDSIRTNPYQPRTEFDQFKLQELSDSIRQHGLIQPITVRHLGHERFELISGERRLRSTRMAGIDTIPAYVREADDEEMIAFAIIENVQREQLNPIEVAIGYQRLIEECELTQEEVAKRMAKNRTTITNTLRLLNLPPSIQNGLKMGKISAGHARTLISIDDPRKQDELYQKTLERELSVRQLEELVRGLGKGNKRTKTAAPKDGHDIEMREITNRLRRLFATKVDLKKKNKGGEIRIEYYTDEELERILNMFDNLGN